MFSHGDQLHVDRLAACLEAFGIVDSKKLVLEAREQNPEGLFTFQQVLDITSKGKRVTTDKEEMRAIVKFLETPALQNFVLAKEFRVILTQFGSNPLSEKELDEFLRSVQIKNNEDIDLEALALAMAKMGQQ